MLLHGAIRRFGSYQYAVVLAVTGLGFVGAPWWMAFIAAALLFGSLVFEQGEAYARGGSTQATATPGGSVLTIAIVSAGFALVCYAGGSLAGVMLE
jgi:hypothetical protein